MRAPGAGAPGLPHSRRPGADAGLGTASYAHADDEASDCAKARKAGRACSLDFKEGETVDGNRPTASGEDVTVLTDAVRSNLIKLRLSFRAEIIRSAEGI